MRRNTITEMTRRVSLDQIIPLMSKRKREICAVLSENAYTVSEIADILVSEGIVPYFDRNRVAPRLTELKGDGIVEPCGVRVSERTGRPEAVWRIVRQLREGAAE